MPDLPAAKAKPVPPKSVSPEPTSPAATSAKSFSGLVVPLTTGIFTLMLLQLFLVLSPLEAGAVNVLVTLMCLALLLWGHPQWKSTQMSITVSLFMFCGLWLTAEKLLQGQPASALQIFSTLLWPTVVGFVLATVVQWRSFFRSAQLSMLISILLLALLLALPAVSSIAFAEITADSGFLMLSPKVVNIMSALAILTGLALLSERWLGWLPNLTMIILGALLWVFQGTADTLTLFPPLAAILLLVFWVRGKNEGRSRWVVALLAFLMLWLTLGAALLPLTPLLTGPFRCGRNCTWDTLGEASPVTAGVLILLLVVALIRAWFIAVDHRIEIGGKAAPYDAVSLFPLLIFVFTLLVSFHSEIFFLLPLLVYLKTKTRRSLAVRI